MKKLHKRKKKRKRVDNEIKDSTYSDNSSNNKEKIYWYCLFCYSQRFDTYQINTLMKLLN